MKITVVALFTCIYTLFATEASSQNVKVSIHANGSSIQEVIHEIEKQTDFLFVYDKKEVNINRRVSLNATNELVSEILNKIFEGTGVVFQLVGKNITLVKQGEMVAGKNSVTQQTVRKITGTVVDQKGEPVIGANVVEKGTTNGTITDIDGKFSLDVPKGSVLEVSYIGYLANEIKVDNQLSLSIKLREDAQALDEVIVVGYGTQKKVNLTGSVATVSSEKIENRPLGTIAEGLQGTMAGVTVTRQSGELGSNPEISVRGFSSLNSGGALVIVDGVPGNMNNISPNDIESISILKDAASSSIYGARAAEGVILITTKQGKASEKVKIQYSNNFSFQKPTIFPKPNSSYDGALYANLAFTNAGGNPLYQDWMLEKFKDPSVIATPYENNSDYYYLADFNWWDHFLNNSFQHTQNLNLSGGERIA